MATGDRTPAADEQARVVAAKFAATGVSPRPPLPALPSTYGENHLLLLVRDPQTVFAAWDIAPTAVEALKARIGRRGFAVSTLTLRLTSAGGAQTVYHVGKRRRSGYLRVAGGPSFVAEIGFTVPSGQFEFVARSAPCFIPLEGGSALPERAVRARVSYREAAALVRRGVPLSRPAKTEGVGSDETKDGPPASYPSPRDKPMSVTTGILGGASDLYRR